MNRKKLTYAMVGGAVGSFIGPIHRMALRMDNLAELVAGNFSRDAKRNAESAAAFGLDPSRVYADWKSLIAAERGKVDFLVICTTNETHYAIAKAALEAGLDVFCEKPLSLTAKEAAELGKLAERKGRVLGVPFTYTGYPMVKLARDLVKRGELGKIDKVMLEYVQGSFRKPDRRTSWKTNPKIAGPSCVVADIGVHAFTMIEYVTGLEVKSLLADLSSFASGGLDDDASILMRLGEGGDRPSACSASLTRSRAATDSIAACSASLTRSRTAADAISAKASLVTSKIATGEENGVRLRVYGDKASLFWDQEAPNYLSVKYPMKPEAIYKRKAPYVDAVSARSVEASRFPAGHHEGFVEALCNIYDEFVAAVRTRKTRDFPGAREGIRSMRFVDAALKSNKAGNRWTKV